MTKLRVPSLQHLARNWRATSMGVKRVLVALALDPPNFTYKPLYSAIHDLLVLRQSYEQIVEGIRRGVKRERVQSNLLSILPLIRDYFDGVNPSFVQAVDRRFYPVGRDLLVPFDPPLIYGVGGQIHFPWFSFWRSNPLKDETLALFVTMVEELLLQDPDLEAARFTILDFSAPKPKAPRRLTLIDARDIPRITPERKAEMLAIFVDGFQLAEAELAGAPRPSDDKRPGRGDAADGQGDLFDNPP
ncbi:hypothetical protein [Azospirillum rugosum]|uniref:Uncharacterized protein n=1 Tax=Azospirillum rugosum TaxID=416170 RepID=A0ABS4SNS0_9PROT|nr:hypothetical protein [Azospirillum rugosum]MBP2293005.1 hypothetical protein [Azospirillum rugosum]MDQ0526554.1 hypothetical protein [Azospirillum rugosum]